MPISEKRLKMRLSIREEQLRDKEILALKLRDKVKGGYLPKTSKELADILKMVHEHAKAVGCAEECKEILEKLSEENPMPMEKYGVECSGNHSLTQPYMEKQASGDVVCRHCGAKFATVQVKDGVGLKDKSGEVPPKDSIERMMNI